MAERLQFLSLVPVGFQFRFVEFCPLPDQFARGRGVDAPHEDLSGKIECCLLALVLSMEMSRRMVVKEHSDDDSEERRDDRHRRMLTDEICDGITTLRRQDIIRPTVGRRPVKWSETRGVVVREA